MLCKPDDLRLIHINMEGEDQLHRVVPPHACWGTNTPLTHKYIHNKKVRKMTNRRNWTWWHKPKIPVVGG